ncbi:MAG TPA: 4Fe-4S binding protein [Candidatus Limnocylindrales bacterium]
MDQSCVAVCPVDCISSDPARDRKFFIDPSNCIDCGSCEQACPNGAIFRADSLRPSMDPPHPRARPPAGNRPHGSGPSGRPTPAEGPDRPHRPRRIRLGHRRSPATAAAPQHCPQRDPRRAGRSDAFSRSLSHPPRRRGADLRARPVFRPWLEVDGNFLQRPYSTASTAGAAATAGELEFLVRRVAGGTFTPFLWKMATDDRIWIGPPKGLFTLKPADHRTHLLVSTGTGLAPFISMADALLRSEPGPRVVVVHGASYVSELAYRDRLEGWAAGGRLVYVPTISRPSDPANEGWAGKTGRTEAILASICREFGLDPLDSVAYLCGNPDMTDYSAAVLAALGFPEGAVVRELYWTAREAG